MTTVLMVSMLSRCVFIVLIYRMKTIIIITRLEKITSCLRVVNEAAVRNTWTESTVRNEGTYTVLFNIMSMRQRARSIEVSVMVIPFLIFIPLKAKVNICAIQQQQSNFASNEVHSCVTFERKSTTKHFSYGKVSRTPHYKKKAHNFL